MFAATLFRFGGAAEYVCLPESYPIASVPDGMTVEEAVTIPTGGLNAMHFQRSASVGDGDAVLVNGAGGSIGTYAVQIAKAFGADVTCVDSEEKLDPLSSLGAVLLADYSLQVAVVTFVDEVVMIGWLILEGRRVSVDGEDTSLAT